MGEDPNAAGDTPVPAKKTWSRQRGEASAPLPRPIDYAALAVAYQAAKWRWGGEGRGNRGTFPTAEQLAKGVQDLERALGPKGTPGELSSGGLHVVWEGDTLLVKLNPKIAKHLNHVYTDKGVSV